MKAIDGLSQVADTFDVAVLDQWGVLHDGTAPYPHAAAALASLHAAGKRIVVLSNSGKRSRINLERIAACGLPVDHIEIVMTSGEALWRDVDRGTLAPFERPFALVGAPGDAENWAEGLDLTFADHPDRADCILAMGFADGVDLANHEELLTQALARDLPLVCSNPDRESPRPGGLLAVQPGALAAAYEERGGRAVWYGKPYGPIFEAVERHCDVPRERLLMVGDSPEHDITGGARAGWATCLVRGGLHARALRPGTEAQVASLCDRHGAPRPDLHMETLRW